MVRPIFNDRQKNRGKNLETNAVEGQTVTLNIPTDGGSVPGTVNTNASGVAQFTLTSSSVPATYTYTATVAALTSAGADVAFLALPSADLEWDVESYDYGTPGAAVTHTFTLTNVGGSTSGTISITRGGPGSKWAIITDNCNGITLAASDSCTVDFEFDGLQNPSGTSMTTQALEFAYKWAEPEKI